MAADPEAAFLAAMKAQQDAEYADLGAYEEEDVPTKVKKETEEVLETEEMVSTPSIPTPDDTEVVVPSGVDSHESAVIASLLSPSHVARSHTSTPVAYDPAAVQQYSDETGDDVGATNVPPSTDYEPGPFVLEEEDEDADASSSDTANVGNDRQHQSASTASSHPINVVPSASNPVSSELQNTMSSDIRTVAPDADAVKNVSNSDAAANQKRKRLAQDTVGMYEDRIEEDPRGDIEAWLLLIDEHTSKGKLDEARAVYERYFAVFPYAAEQWVAYCNLELNANALYRLEQIFQRVLVSVYNVELWSIYLDYLRRTNNVVTEGEKARQTITQAYEFVLNNIGNDRDSGRLWQDYITFIKSGPGSVGGSNWQDQQKMDHLRRVYQRVICVPVDGVEKMWKEYDGFEMGMNKMTGRKFLQEKSPLHMTARSSLAEMKNVTAGLIRDALPRLPPAPGCEYHDEFNKQVGIWKRWLDWEKSDPLVIAADDIVGYQKRVLYLYRQCLMPMRFWPEFWYDAFEWCLEVGKEKEALQFLKDGLKANPESCLLHFRYAEYLESSTVAPPTEDKEATRRRSAPIRQIYTDILDTYYNMTAKVEVREEAAITKLEHEHAHPSPKSPNNGEETDPADKERQKNAQIEVLKQAATAEKLILSKTISSIWINLMKAMRRVEGHGKVGGDIGGSRQIFADARKRGKVTSDVFVASALIEYHCYKDPAASRIFDRGMKFFPNDEEFALEYMKFLTQINDLTNARAVFESFVSKVPPEQAERVKRLYHFFYNYESQYGELNQIIKLEKRMKELYPTEPHLRAFTSRYAYKSVDPALFVPIVSNSQLRFIKNEDQKSQPVAQTQEERSPKRPAEDDSDFTHQQAERPNKKVHRERERERERERPVAIVDRSPQPAPLTLKGAAGRRLDQQKRAAAALGKNLDRGYEPAPALPSGPLMGPAPIPDAVMFLLSILPSSAAYSASRFNPEAMVKLLADVILPHPSTLPKSFA